MKKWLRLIGAVIMTISFYVSAAQSAVVNKPTICILGGTPSSKKIIDEIPDDLKAIYNFISFNRPGFGGTPNESWDRRRLFALATEAGLKKKDFAVIGVSGGGPLAILIARHFNLQHCGIISGMVPAQEYFAFADSTFTKPIMRSVINGIDSFRKTIESFPNVAEVLQQADSPIPVAIRASYDDLRFILSKISFDRKTFKKTRIDWLHGENDRNVALGSVQLFLEKFGHADLSIIPDAGHAVDARILVRQLIDKWTGVRK